MTPYDQTAERETASGPSLAVAAADVSVEIAETDSQIPALIEQAQSGDREAFAALYREYMPSVYKFLFYRLNGNKAMAEDFTAEVFLRALRKIGDYTWTGANFGAWLMRIARNLVLDHAKSSRAKRELLNDEMPEAEPDDETSTETAVMRNALNGDLYGAIKRLSPDQRDVITMRFIQGMEVAEVAEALGKKEGTIRTLQFRGLKAMQKLLVREGVVDITDTPIRSGGNRDPENGRSGGRTESEAARFGIAEGER